MPCLRGISGPRPPLALFIVSLLAGCGSGPGGPTGSPPPTTTATPPPGPVAGRYLLQIVPAPGCSMSRSPLTFPMVAAAAGTSPHPGLQVLLDGNPSALEWELLSESLTVRGGLGTTGDGVLSNEATRMWVHAIGTGPVTRASDGRGEVTSGTLMGYVALGGPDDEEGALGTCTARDHAFSLRIR